MSEFALTLVAVVGLLLGAMRWRRGSWAPISVWLPRAAGLSIFVSLVWAFVFGLRQEGAKSSLDQYMNPINCYDPVGCNPPDPGIAQYGHLLHVALAWAAVSAATLATAIAFKQMDARYVRCPACQSRVPAAATICRSCRSELGERPEPAVTKTRRSVAVASGGVPRQAPMALPRKSLGDAPWLTDRPHN